MNHAEHLLKSLFVMASMVEARDPYTGGHLWRVSQFCRILAEDGGLPANEVARIALGGFLHDLGKISVPDAILNKPDKLTAEEYEVIKTHPEVGSRLLADHPLAELARSAILSHHETPDGGGYPHGLSGPAISVDASIVGICDAFDAMTSTRPYRKGIPTGKALGIIQENLGRQFHAAWGQRFIRLGGSGKLDHIVGHSEQGIPLQTCPMCGPTIVISRRHLHGDHVYCRSCGGEASVDRSGGRLSIAPTGRRGSKRDLEPEIDSHLLDELVRESSRHLALAA
ncbi:MAG: phosphohydrolase [Betaproteobacteria bacterium HGW-Betaproteobacteria-2]|nr:MAG: phosphohydrolase [Betaproteobacteria bacterium HGW-Betaproteobacteria-2]